MSIDEFNNDKKLAVLIDADNISAHHVQPVMEEIARYGVPTIKRIYGDWTSPSLGSWKNCLLDYAIQPIQQFGYTKGKNSTDSSLIIDAMDILYSGKVEGFCIVSSDSDFTRLATRLREAGMTVFGIGEQKTPNAFIVACDKFIYIDVISDYGKTHLKIDDNSDPSTGKAKSSQNSTSQAAKKVKTKPLDINVRKLIYSSVEAVADEDGWASLGEVGSIIMKKVPSFDPRNYGFSKLSNLVRSMSGFEISERVVSASSKNIQIYLRLI